MPKNREIDLKVGGRESKCKHEGCSVPVPSTPRVVIVELPPPTMEEEHDAIHLWACHGDSILWTCAHDDFEILSVVPNGPLKAGAPRNPFYRTFGRGKKPKGAVCFCSGPVKPKAAEQEYKFTCRVGKKPYDPHIFTHR